MHAPYLACKPRLRLATVWWPDALFFSGYPASYIASASPGTPSAQGRSGGRLPQSGCCALDGEGSTKEQNFQLRPVRSNEQPACVFGQIVAACIAAAVLRSRIFSFFHLPLLRLAAPALPMKLCSIYAGSTEEEVSQEAEPRLGQVPAAFLADAGLVQPQLLEVGPLGRGEVEDSSRADRVVAEEELPEPGPVRAAEPLDALPAQLVLAFVSAYILRLASSMLLQLALLIVRTPSSPILLFPASHLPYIAKAA